MTTEKKSFYISTPIYYPSDKLHIGHTYSTVAADTIARFKKLLGYDVFFLTGTDEHGQKIEQAAIAAGKEPKEYVDKIVESIVHLWEVMNIDYDKFIRTTDAYHVKSIQSIFRKLYEQGDIYKSYYEGWYCTPCEAYWTNTQLDDGKCPDCGREVHMAKEEAYFFKMSNYAQRLIDHIHANPNFISPESAKNEMLNNFLLPGLEDLCVSRTSFQWGIPVDFDEKHVVYVWVDALSNYISALGYLNDEPQLMDRFWPADVHLIGKDILRFHTIYWPIILMALGLELPKQIYGHGWILLKGGKMSKSKGNVIDPIELVEKYGTDTLRYYVLREMPFGGDGVYSEDNLITRNNADLANDLGNLLSRTTSMVDKYFGGYLPKARYFDTIDTDLIQMATDVPFVVAEYMHAYEISNALAHIWKFVSRVNKYIDETEPWVLAKDENNQARLATVLYNLLESLRIIAVLISAAMPQTAAKMQEALQLSEEAMTWQSILTFGKYPAENKICPSGALFPRVMTEEEEKRIEKRMEKEKKKMEKNTETNNEIKAEEVTEPYPPFKETITIEEFAKVDMRVATIIKAEKHPNADKLLVLQADLGYCQKQIVTGIAEFKNPDELVGKQIVVVVNLKPAKFRGMVSEAMITAVGDYETFAMIVPEKEVQAGEMVK
ncbi:MAG: methionine--tRNA ligase [Eubacteriaceae bacterium]|jgi:methionyl-tRNA synthetase|nr:methionine--tRNA ligase [Eubacteriaceae bacterium]